MITTMYRLSQLSIWWIAVYVMLASGLTGCTVKLISDYDETTDRAVSALQRKTESHLVTLENVENLPDCVYDKHKQFYDDAKIDVSAITVRAAAIPKNNITTKETQLLLDSLEKLERLHKISCLSKDQIALLRSHFNTSYTAILKLELAKRRGE